MEIIKVENGQALLSPAVSQRIAEFERDIKTLTDARDKLRNDIKEAMEERGIIKVETEELLINYIQETDRETFDTKTFRSEHPEFYDHYVKMTKVKPSVRIKVK